MTSAAIEWITRPLGGPPPRDGEVVERHGRQLTRTGGIARDIVQAGITLVARCPTGRGA